MRLHRVALVLVGLFLGACGLATTPASQTPSAGSRVGPYDATLPVHSFSVTVEGPDGKVEGATVTAKATILGSPVSFGPTDKNGLTVAKAVTIGDYLLNVEKAGMGVVEATIRLDNDVNVTMILRSLARHGIVKKNGHAVADDDGPFNALGASLFWGAWGYKFDRLKLEENLAALQSAGVDYVRVLGSVGPGGWTNRYTDVKWDDYSAVIAGFTDLAYDKYGIRTQWTIFGGSPDTPSGAKRQQVVDQFLAMSKGREHKLFAFEIANESWQNGFEGTKGQAELRALGKRLASGTNVLVALSAPNTGTVCSIYADSGVDAATMHYERKFGADDVSGFHFRPVRQPWGYPDEYDLNCKKKLPEVVFNNEPIGPESSVDTDDQPLDMALGYVVTFIARNAAYVFHAGPGIRGGGPEDLSRGRHANYQDLPKWNQYVTALKAAKDYLPKGIANWSKQNAQWPGAPFIGFDKAVSRDDIVRAYAATTDSQFIVAVLGIKRPVTVQPRWNSHIDVIDPANGKILAHLDKKANESFVVDHTPAVILRGTRF